jgi:glyoxylase I family protein
VICRDRAGLVPDRGGSLWEDILLHICRLTGFQQPARQPGGPGEKIVVCDVSCTAKGTDMTRLTIVCTALVVFAGVTFAQAPPTPPRTDTKDTTVAMERVEGIGGFFFKSKSPKSLAQWYSDHLGVTLTPPDYDHQPWQQAAGPTAFEPFPADSEYFGSADRTFMLNFRVRNLDAMVAQLRRAGIKVDVDPKTYPNGRFARLSDPEDNPIQLWQPQRKTR